MALLPAQWTGRIGLNLESDAFSVSNLGSAGPQAIDHPTVNLQFDINRGFDHIRYTIRPNWLYEAISDMNLMAQRWQYIENEINRLLSTGATVVLTVAPNIYHSDPVWDADMVCNDFPYGPKWRAHEIVLQYIMYALHNANYGVRVAFQPFNEYRGNQVNLMRMTQRQIDVCRTCSPETTLLINSDGTGSMDNIERMDWNHLNHRGGRTIMTCFAYNFQVFTHQQTGGIFVQNGLHYPPDNAQRTAQHALIDASALPAPDKATAHMLLDIYFDTPCDYNYLLGKAQLLTNWRASRPTAPPWYVPEHGCHTFASGKPSALIWFTDVRRSFQDNPDIMGWAVWSRGPDSYFDLRALPSKAFDASYYTPLLGT